MAGDKLFELQAENAELRRQLAEAEDTLRAIRSGEVDALVVPTTTGSSLYTLEGAYEPYRRFVEQMQEGAATIASDGVIVYANRRFGEIVGVPGERIVGSSIHEVFGEANRPLLDTLLNSAASGTGNADIVPGGAPRIHLYLSVSDLYDGMRCLVITDISEHVQLRQAVVARDWLRVTLASIGDAVISCDLESRITFLNPVAVQLTGWAEADSLGQPLHRVFDLVNEVTGEAANDLVGRVLSEGRVVLLGNHTALVTRDGRRLSIEDSAAPITDDSGTITGAVIVFHDVTEKRRDRYDLIQSEARLRESEERFRTMADDTPVMIWVTDMSGGIEFVNRAYLDFFGVTTADVKQGGWQPLVHPDDSSAYVGAFMAALRDRTPFRAQARVRRADGQWRWVDSHGIPRFSASGDILGMAGSSPDITDRMEFEQQLRDTAQKLAEANRIKDDFLATLSHELRTPMSAIVGWAQILTTRKPDPATTQRGLEAILRNSQSQMQLITDILDVSRIVSGRLRLDVRPVDLGAVMYAALDVVRPAADAKGIALTTDIAAASTVITGDADRLQQVVWNLVTNAVKFTPSGGTVHVSLRRTGSQFALSVRDSGIGIDPNFLPRVFERFTQADGSAQRQHGGLGLGLSIVRHLVELHGGTVEVESEGEGKGATFIVHLPVRAVQDLPHDVVRASSTAIESAVAAPVSLAGIRILVVDDEADARDLITTLLTDSEAHVVAAPSSAEAPERLKDGRFDVLLADIGMPGENGYEFIRKVRQLPAEAGGTVPAVALTAYSRSQDAERALASGFQVHLTKPVSQTDLVGTVARLARQEEAAE